MVVIPDIFESFMSRAPAINPNYEVVAEEALKWANETCGYSHEEAKRMRGADYAYFAGVAFPDAEAKRLRTVMDWLNWIVVFDDQIDDGPLGRQKKEAGIYIDAMAGVLDMSDQPGNLNVHQSVLGDIRRKIRDDPQCAPGAKLRWKKHMKDYLAGLKDSVDFVPGTELEDTISRYISYRLCSLGALPLYAFIEYTCELHIPDEIFHNESLTQLERIGLEIMMLANDCVSYRRERDQQCPHNIIHLLCHEMSEQEACNKVGNMMRQKYRQWYLALAGLPILGEDIDREVHRYIEGIQNICLANAHWSFKTERYFGKDRDQVRKTRQLATGKVDWQLPPVLLPNNHEVNATSMIRKMSLM